MQPKPVTGEEAKRIMDAYFTMMKSGKPPSVMDVGGNLLLKYRPDLADIVDPNKWYRLTAQPDGSAEITEVDFGEGYR